MNGLPLHPAIVHLPLGLAVIIPLGALLVVWLAWRGARSGSDPLARGPLTALIVAQALLVGGGLVARAAGESDEDRVETIVTEAAIEKHEDQSGVFVLSGALVLGGLLAAWALAKRGRVARPLVTMAAIGTLGVLASGLAVGHSGGELVYRYGAAAAHVAPDRAVSDLLTPDRHREVDD
jgi:hypothetical protein